MAEFVLFLNINSESEFEESVMSILETNTKSLTTFEICKMDIINNVIQQKDKEIMELKSRLDNLKAIKEKEMDEWQYSYNEVKKSKDKLKNEYKELKLSSDQEKVDLQSIYNNLELEYNGVCNILQNFPKYDEIKNYIQLNEFIMQSLVEMSTSDTNEKYNIFCECILLQSINKSENLKELFEVNKVVSQQKQLIDQFASENNDLKEELQLLNNNCNLYQLNEELQRLKSLCKVIEKENIDYKNKYRQLQEFILICTKNNDTTNNNSPIIVEKEVIVYEKDCSNSKQIIEELEILLTIIINEEEENKIVEVMNRIESLLHKVQLNNF